MRHAQHLRALAQVAQLPTDDLGHRAADAGIDLVEHHAQRRGLGRRRHLHGEADARQFAAGGDLGEALGRLPGIGAHQKFDVVAAVGGELGLAWLRR